MDFRLTPEDEAFRREVAEFLDRELTPEVREEFEERGLPGRLYYQFMRKVGEKGWLGMTWPPEYGGQGRLPLHRFIFIEELAKRGVEYRNIAESIVGPTLILYGTEEQRKKYLPKIARGEAVFCLLYSEPHAGSDLASLELRAERKDGGYVLSGQKLFSSEADIADHAWVAARTDPTAPKHKGISLFILDMSSPGITVKPLISLAGDRRFNEVYLDGVWVPEKNRVGEENRGWYYIAVALDFERATAGAAGFIGNATTVLQELISYAKETGLAKNPLVRQRLAQRAIELETLKALSYRLLWLLGQGKVPNYEASEIKLFGSELTQRLAQNAMELLGLYAQLGRGASQAPFRGRLALFYLRSISDTIRGGTSEIQRNIIALRGLGLPTG